MKLLSIAIPCYNSEAYMRHCIESLLPGGDEVEILIVDDAAFMRKVIRDTLTKNGFTDLHEAVDGKDAVEKYFELQPDLVLMDITMPNMDGLEALKAIRAKDNKANVVMCSAMGQEAMVVEAVQAGIKDFIVKPFKEDRLMKTVNSILGNP